MCVCVESGWMVWIGGMGCVGGLKVSEGNS